MKVWITHSGWTPQAVVNTIKAARREDGVEPNKVIVLTGSVADKEVAEKAQEVKRRLSQDLGISNVVLQPFDERNLEAYVGLLEDILKQHLNDDLYLDITPGRKFMSLVLGFLGYALHSVGRGNVRAVYYLHLFDKNYQNAEYEEIPPGAQRLVNILKFIKI